MVSKTKSNGCTGAQRVQKAIRKCRCTTPDFFFRAALRSPQPDNVCLEFEAQRFGRFCTFGPIGVSPDYKIPGFVLEFADLVSVQKNPEAFFKTFRVPVPLEIPAQASA